MSQRYKAWTLQQLYTEIIDHKIIIVKMDAIHNLQKTKDTHNSICLINYWKLDVNIWKKILEENFVFSWKLEKVASEQNAIL